MPDKPVFWDTNVWIYLFADSNDLEDKRKNSLTRQLFLEYPDIVISVQVLNELSNVWLKKYQLEHEKIKLYLQNIQELTEVRLLDEIITFQALDLLENYNFSFYDSLIVASALDADCGILFSEDMHDELWIDARLKIKNPFNLNPSSPP